jgi:uncharacterized protein (TIGR03435 family)
MTMPTLLEAGRFSANHLWQSTLVACAAAALVWLQRHCEARVRHAIWLAASVKFVLPFALLTEVGARLLTRGVPASAPTPLLAAVTQIGRPFAASGSVVHADPAARHPFPWLLCVAVLWACGCLVVLISWLLRWRRIDALAQRAVAQNSGRELEALRAAEAALGIRRPTVLLLSEQCMEPGVFGMFRPALLWPREISTHLDEAQLASIVMHEACHVRRRDNLLALLPMAVEALFWFHPLVWWMGARLLEERERACDEAVLHLGHEPARYAEAILKACRFCVESPLSCVAGVSGSDLKQRMVRIMNAWTIPLSRSRKMLLASIALTAVAGPVLLGALHPRVVQADSPSPAVAAAHFDSVSLKPSQTRDAHFGFLYNDGAFIDNNVTMRELIGIAYGVRADRVTGGPDWVSTQRFDFEARWTPTSPASTKVPPPPPPVMMATAGGIHMAPPPVLPPDSGQLQAMMRNYLTEHLNLTVRDDSVVQPTFALVVANGGAKLTPVTEHTDEPEQQNVRFFVGADGSANGDNQTFAVTNGDLRGLARMLTERMGMEVTDKTGLTGKYNITLSLPGHGETDEVAAALRDQLGLDLQSGQGPVKMFAIENVDVPPANGSK